MKALRKRLAAEERGFTLVEALVTMLMMLTVLAALHGVFSTSLRVFSFGNDKVESVENARLGLQRMEREIRAAQPSDGEILQTAAPQEISFYLSTGDSASDTTLITYERYSSSSGYALGRSEGDEGSNEAVSQFVTSLDFTYLDADGNETSEEPEINGVRISLTVEVNDGTQELNTEVFLRNRGTS